ncbi:TetR/AcrR family transcriptional regulator [Sphingomonas sp. GB1N7]|uniref:TetR/AcrR family transcriptional regulator n=1 Tax=Parasphingomonas caseinilytica TaxID=3096158 RepID=UPI002FC9A6A0
MSDKSPSAISYTSDVKEGTDHGIRPTRAPRQRGEQQRAIDTRERIIAAATEEFAAQGYDGASVRTVADRAGARHTMVTYHFTGKEGLWQAVMDRLVRTFTSQQMDRLDGLRGVSEVIQLRLLLEEFIRYSASDLNLHRLMGHAASRASPEIETMVSDYLQDYFNVIAGLIGRVQKKGAFVEGEPHHLHYIFIGAATRIFMQSPEVTRVMGRSPLDPDFIDQHIETCLRLFFVGKPTKRAPHRRDTTASDETILS